MEEQTDAQGTEREARGGRLAEDWQQKLVECCGVRHPEAIRDEEIARRFVVLHEEIKRKDVQIEKLQEKLLDERKRLADYCADYERKLNEFNWRDFSEYRHGFHYYRENADALYEVYGKLRDYVPVLIKRLEREQAKYEKFSSESELKAFYMPFQIDASEALKVLNTLQSVLDSYKNSQADDEKQTEVDKVVEKENRKGFRRLFAPNTYRNVMLLDELHQLFDEQKLRDYVPYILLLLEEKALVRRPSWNDVHDEFVKAKGGRSDY